MPVHEDEHSGEGVRRVVEHGTRDHLGGAGAQTRRNTDLAHARVKQITSSVQNLILNRTVIISRSFRSAHAYSRRLTKRSRVPPIGILATVAALLTKGFAISKNVATTPHNPKALRTE